MAQYAFGTGQIYGLPVGGGAPLQFGALQDVSVDISADIKQLYGQYQFPLAVARGKAKIEGKASTGEVNPDLYNTLYFGDTGATRSVGSKIPAFIELGSIPASGAYTVTVANSAHFVLDLGVRNAVTGAKFTQVESGPAAGEYSVAAGVYTFAAADAGSQVAINYIYTDSTDGITLDLANALMGVAPTFMLVLTEEFDGKSFILVLYSCTSSKLTFPFKQDDFMISEFDFQAQANDAGLIGYISASLVAPA